jgi:hypothetical protein
MWEWEDEEPQQNQFHDNNNNNNTSHKPDQIPDPNSYLNFDFFSALSKPKVPKPSIILIIIFYE